MVTLPKAYMMSGTSIVRSYGFGRFSDLDSNGNYSLQRGISGLGYINVSLNDVASMVVLSTNPLLGLLMDFYFNTF